MASYFAIFLVLLSVGSGLLWLVDAKVLAPKRELKLAEAEGKLGDGLDEKTRKHIMRQPAWAETAQSIFPVVLAITIFRSFLFEPFQIPSGSMKPTLLVGDFILVKKYAYGIKDPVTRSKWVETGVPERGDVAVFKYPEDTHIDFIKRIVGLPGDHIVYRDKALFIKPTCERDPDHCTKFHKVEQTLLGKGEFQVGPFPLDRYKADMLGYEHELLIGPDYPSREKEYFTQTGTRSDEWVVPEGHYFAVGDNRDNSKDSRYWGFVPDENLVGEAVFIWMSFEFGRDPTKWYSFIPTDVRFSRLGNL